MKSINCYSNKTRFLLILAGLCIIFRLPAQNNPNSLGKIIQKDFATAKGTVTAFFPGEMAVGEKISSALIIKPAGKTQQQIQQNRDFLSGNIFKIGSQQVNPKGTCIQFSVPENLHENFLPVEWLDNKMKVLSHSQIPVTNQPLFQLPANMLENFPPTIPTYVESGIPAVIFGPFDGNFANTRLQIAGKDAEILAESPGELFFKGPDEITGTCDVVVSEQNQVYEGKTRVVGLELFCPEPRLKTGEYTTIKIRVLGLGNLDSPQTLLVENLTPTVLQLGSGNNQRFVINPENVQPDGIWTHTIVGQSVKSGDFSVQVQIAPPLDGFIFPTSPSGQILPNRPLEFTWQEIGLPPMADYELSIFKNSDNANELELLKKIGGITQPVFKPDEPLPPIGPGEFYSWHVKGNSTLGTATSMTMNFQFGPVEPGDNPPPPGDPCDDPKYVEKEQSDCEWIVDMEIREPLGDITNDFNDFKIEWKEHFRVLSRTLIDFEMQASMIKYWIGEGDKMENQAEKIQKLANLVKKGIGHGATAFKEGGEEALKEMGKELVEDKVKEWEQYAATQVSQTLGALYDLEDMAIRQIGLGIAKGITGVYPDKMADMHRRNLQILAADLSTWVSLSQNRTKAFGEHPTLQGGISEMCDMLNQLDQMEKDFNDAVGKAGFICIKCEIPGDLKEQIAKLRLELESHIRYFGDTIDQIRQRMVETRAIMNNKKAYEDVARLGSFQANSERQTREINHVLEESERQFKEALSVRKTTN